MPEVYKFSSRYCNLFRLIPRFSRDRILPMSLTVTVYYFDSGFTDSLTEKCYIAITILPQKWSVNMSELAFPRSVKWGLIDHLPVTAYPMTT